MNLKKGELEQGGKGEKTRLSIAYGSTSEKKNVKGERMARSAKNTVFLIFLSLKKDL